MKSHSSYTAYSLAALRVLLGWLFFYAGITKVLDPEWTAAGFLSNANTFPEFFAFLAQPHIIPFVDFANEWGLTLLGVSLILGIFVRLSAPLGAALMILYYFPGLEFPYPNVHSYIVDDHLIYAAALLLIASLRAGRVWGIASVCKDKWPRACKDIASYLD